jgi:hypothetical protein
VPITTITFEDFKGIEGLLKIELKPIKFLICPKSPGRTLCVDKGFPNDNSLRLFRMLRQGEFSFVVISVLTGQRIEY